MSAQQFLVPASRDKAILLMDDLKTKNARCLSQIAAMNVKIKERAEHISALQAFIDRPDISKLKKPIQEAPKKPIKEYLKIGDNCGFSNVGLHNKRCKNPEGVCTKKCCFLSYKDIRNKKCLLKLCKHFKWLNESAEAMLEVSELISKLNAQKQEVVDENLSEQCSQ